MPEINTRTNRLWWLWRYFNSEGKWWDLGSLEIWFVYLLARMWLTCWTTATRNCPTNFVASETGSWSNLCNGLAAFPSTMRYQLRFTPGCWPTSGMNCWSSQPPPTKQSTARGGWGQRTLMEPPWNLTKRSVTHYIDCCSLMFDDHYWLGCNQLGDSSDLPHLHDGQTHHHGPAETRCWNHGREDHKGHHDLQKL